MLGIKGGECSCGFESEAGICACYEDCFAGETCCGLCDSHPPFAKEGEWIWLHGSDLDKVLVGEGDCEELLLPAFLETRMSERSNATTFLVGEINFRV